MCLPAPIDHHLQAFQAAGAPTEAWLGRPTQAWASAVTGDAWAALPEQRLDRYELADRLPHLSAEERLLAICAWGGMRVSNGRRVWKARDGVPAAGAQRPLMHLIGTLPGLPRAEGYAGFRALRHQRPNLLPGMGPAYFTKLIHFLGRAAPQAGYILDQWTAKSVNLLFGPLVLMSDGRVTDQNTAAHYERYCQAVERLARLVPGDVEPAEVEHRLFAAGPWRDYVIANAPKDVREVQPLCDAERLAA